MDVEIIPPSSEYKIRLGLKPPVTISSKDTTKIDAMKALLDAIQTGIKSTNRHGVGGVTFSITLDRSDFDTLVTLLS